MSSDMLTAIIGALVGGVCTLLVTLFAIKLQHRRKIIEFTVSSMPLFRFKPMVGTLAITVDKSILTGEEIDKGKYEQIDNVYGFQIDLFNVGNDDVENPIIDIRLHDSAKIVGYETQPASKPGYEIKLQRDSLQPNVFRIQVPFINRNEHITVRLVSTGNVNKECKVEALGLGIRTRIRRSEVRQMIALAALTLLPPILLVLTTFLPDSFVLSVGGHFEQTKISHFPTWIHIVEYSIVFTGFSGAFLIALKRSIGKKEIEWEESKKNPTFWQRLLSQ